MNRCFSAWTGRLNFHRWPLGSGCVLMLCMATLVGCGGPAVAVSDPQAARHLLEQTLRAWQSGKTVEELRQSDPPVYVAEELWQRGGRLEYFTIDDAGEIFGTNVRLDVTLHIADRTGKPAPRQLTYLVTTTPAYTIARQDR